MRNPLIALVTLSAAALGGCSGGEESGGAASSNLSPTPPPVAAPAPVQPPPPPLPPVETLACSPCKKVAFVSTRDGNYEIYSVNADSTELTRLTDNDSFDTGPAWSPDGRRIAFTSNRDFDGSADPRYTGKELYVMDADGSNAERLTFSKSDAWEPAWSPDGTRIAYGTGSDLWEVPAEGGTPKLLFSTPGLAWQPAWSPDGTRLALVSDWFAYDFVTDVFLINTDGSGFTAVTDGNIFDQVNYAEPAWSPDGGRFAMSVSQRLGTFEYATRIGLASANGSDLTLLPTPGGEGFDGVSVGTPSWSPDGTMIAYTSCLVQSAFDYDDDRCDVAWIKADGSARGTIITNGRDPDWQR